ncbi:carbohydrate ABC transporter permease [Brevibacillus sp. NPDC003359]|uniref:carbohydrate ABC transporter permease n=1 Tax=unclassified Brevibacillus TaxID=2684853 RepID=UPI00368B1FA9
MHRDHLGWRTGRVIILTLFLAFAIFPLYWIIITSLKGQKEIFSLPIQYWPEQVTLINYLEIFQISHFQVYIWNSFLVSLVASAMVVFIAMLGGYVLARFSFKGKRQVMFGFLVTQMIPMFIGMAPLYMMMSKMHILNSLFSLMLIYTVMLIPFCTIIMSGFFQRIPNAFIKKYDIEWGAMSAATVLSVIPTMLLFAFCQKYLVEGLTQGAVKG